ncbi:MAG: ABC transporter substrate-binding protein [Candidatus Bathyarchaeota archaeon]|nr:ABC transporter substrate-binding protein [Candidatus Bathyarchaeota archaeon]
MNLKLDAKCFIVLLVASMLTAGFAASSAHAQGIRYGGRVDNIRFKVIKSPDAQTLAMQRGDVDVLTGLTRPADIESLASARKKILSTPGDHICYVAFNMRSYMSGEKPSPFGPQSGAEPGVTLRHAIAHLVPKTVLIGSLFKYIVTLINTPMASCIGNFGADVDTHPFDPAQALAIFNAGGYVQQPDGWHQPGNPDPIPVIDFISPTMEAAPTSWTIAETVVQNMLDLGLDATHTELDLTTIINKIDAGDFDMFFLYWEDMGRFGDHLYNFFHSSNDFPGGYNRPGLRNDTLDGVLMELYTTLDKPYMEQKVKEALELLIGTSAYTGSTNTDGILPYIPIYSRTYYDAYDLDLIGIVNAKMKGSWNYWTVCNLDWDSGLDRWSDLPIFDPGTKTMAIFCQGEDYQYPANPAWVSSTVTWDQIDYIYDSLIGMNPYNLKDKPGWLDLSRDPDPNTTPGYNIEEWTVTDGPAAGDTGMKVTFYPKTTVDRPWHDGHLWDVWDVAFAWEYLTANKIPRSWSTMEYFHHCEVNYPDNDAITAYMTTTSIVLPYGLSEWSSMFPEHVWGCTHGRGGRAVAGCGTEDRETAWNAQLSWINSGEVAGTAGTKPGTDSDADVESGLCLCAVDPGGQSAEGKLTCEHGSGCVIDDRTTVENEILDYDPAGYPWPTAAYPWLTEQIGTGSYVYYSIDVTSGIGNLVVFDERTHDTVMPGVHYPLSVDEVHNTLVEFFWELGDVDLDGQITILDISIMGANFMNPVPPAPWRADIDQDGWITIRDMSYCGINYGEERERIHTMHVESIGFKQKGPKSLDVMVTIHDDARNPVVGATVYMDLTYPDGTVITVSADTNDEGIATYQISRPEKGTYTVTIVVVSHGKLSYNPNDNVETTDSYAAK